MASLKEDEIQCLQILYTSAYEIQRERFTQRVPKTCELFLVHQKYKAWLDEKGPSLLWVTGDPGCGKSVLSSFLVEKLGETAKKAEKQTTVCFFFLKDDSNDQKDASSALCSILHQIYMIEPRLISNCMHDFRTKGRKFISELRELWNIFTATVMDGRCGDILCVLDSLDEASEKSRYRLIKALVEFYSSDFPTNRAIKFLVTSRPYSAIERAFQSLPTIRLKAEDQTAAIEEDIMRVVKSRVQRIASMKELSAEAKADLESRLIRKADKSFLWISLVLQVIETSPRASQRALYDAIVTGSSSLDTVYEKILANLSKTLHIEFSKKLLHIVVAAARPLTLGEMNIALNIQESDKAEEDLDLEPAIDTVIRDLSDLFIRIIDDKIYLIHHTAKEYLQTPLVSVPAHSSSLSHNSVAWKHSLSPIQSNLILAQSCIYYLSLSTRDTLWVAEIDNVSLRNWSNNKGPFPLQHEFRPFLEYASCYWPYHFNLAHSLPNLSSPFIMPPWSPLTSAATSLLRPISPPRYRRWYAIHSSEFGDLPFRMPPPVTLAVLLGLLPLVASLLAGGQAIDVLDQKGWTALCHSVSRGLYPVVAYLVDHGADIFATKPKHQTPLHLAARNGNPDIVTLLLAKGANVDAIDQDKWTALSLAVLYDMNVRNGGHSRVVQILLDAGASIDMMDEHGQTPLHFTVRSCGCRSDDKVLRLIEMLLTASRNVNIKNMNGCTALHMAVASCASVEVMELLLISGLDVGLRNKHGLTALHIAVGKYRFCKSCPNVVKMLLEAGGNIKARDNYGRTVVQSIVSSIDWIKYCDELEWNKRDFRE